MVPVSGTFSDVEGGQRAPGVSPSEAHGHLEAAGLRSEASEGSAVCPRPRSPSVDADACASTCERKRRRLRTKQPPEGCVAEGGAGGCDEVARSEGALADEAEGGTAAAVQVFERPAADGPGLTTARETRHCGFGCGAGAEDASGARAVDGGWGSGGSAGDCPAVERRRTAPAYPTMHEEWLRRLERRRLLPRASG